MHDANVTLQETLEKAWSLIENGAQNRDSPFHCPAISTINNCGFPSSRTVVLRGLDQNKRIVRFHTDSRSSKFNELKNNPKVAFLFYDIANKVQIRLAGKVEIHRNDTTAENFWEKSQRNSKICYSATHAPGAFVSEPPLAPLPTQEQLSQSYLNFCVILTKVSKLEWLYLNSNGHQRAVFDWSAGMICKSSWLAP